MHFLSRKSIFTSRFHSFRPGARHTIHLTYFGPHTGSVSGVDTLAPNMLSWLSADVLFREKITTRIPFSKCYMSEVKWSFIMRVSIVEIVTMFMWPINETSQIRWHFLLTCYGDWIGINYPWQYKQMSEKFSILTNLFGSNTATDIDSE